MDRRSALSLGLVLYLHLIAGCTPSPISHKPHRQGPKVNLSHFLQHTGTYKGKTITLTLTIDEKIDRSQGQSLRQHTNRDVNFTARDPRGERFLVVIRIPETISIPEAASGDEVDVTFTCTRGDLRQGNEAKTIEMR
jgi:hypothetical protein